MKLTAFRVTNYRSIRDSGTVQLRDRTVLVGRNESGKSNLLLALQSLNPAGGLTAVDFTKDFPLDKLKSDFDSKAEFAFTTWMLSEDEQAELTKIFPRARGVKQVEVDRQYAKAHSVGFEGMPDLAVDEIQVKTLLEQARDFTVSETAEQSKPAVETAWTKFGKELADIEDPSEWAAKVPKALQNLKAALQKVAVTVPTQGEVVLAGITDMATRISKDAEAEAKARDWIVAALPTFVYLDEYPDLQGHQDMEAYMNRKGNNQLNAADRNFEKICKVAGLKPEEVYALKDKDSETRNRMANRASAVVTSRIQKLWTDARLKVRFNLDGRYFDTFVSDDKTVYDVEVNLNERSRGFRWFFSFYITFTADTMDGDKDTAVLLLDEPGLYLHASSQSDLIQHLRRDFKNQIVYTTHSPFMVPIDDMESIRTVVREGDLGTRANNDLVGDATTLFPLQSALGYTLSQTLFVGPHNLVVEGVTDYWYLSGVSEALRDAGKTALPKELIVTPCGGAPRIPTMVALMAAQRLDVLVLLDHEPQAIATRETMVKQKLLAAGNILLVSDALSKGTNEADIEDLIDPHMYEALVKEAYHDDLKGKTIALNSAIPRIVKRYEGAFADAGLVFNKTRPAKLFLRKLQQAPASFFTGDTEANFQQLFSLITKRHGAVQANRKAPFESVVAAR